MKGNLDPCVSSAVKVINDFGKAPDSYHAGLTAPLVRDISLIIYFCCSGCCRLSQSEAGDWITELPSHLGFNLLADITKSTFEKMATNNSAIEGKGVFNCNKA